MDTVNVRLVLSRLVVAGNILFILWILFNGMDSGWKATALQWLVYISLISLLSLSSILLLQQKAKR